jgi:hypothetical protein
MRPTRRRNALLAAAAALLALQLTAPTAPAASLTATLRDGRTGFSIHVPHGFKLKQHDGVYTIANGRIELIWARAKTSQTAAQAGDAVARGEQATVSGRTASSKSFKATLATAAKGKRVLEIRRRGAYLTIATYAGVPKRRGKKASSGPAASVSTTTATAAAASLAAAPAATPPLAHIALSANDLAVLRQIAGTANGGRPVALGSGIRLKPFTAQDGSATAFVPDRPGWSYDGLKGVIEGANANEGAFAFGVVFYVQTPATFILLRDARFPQAPGFLDAAGALTTALPQWFNLCCKAQLTNMTITGQLPGSEQFLGFGYQSGFFTANFTLNGKAWQGVFLLGTNPTTGVDGTFYVYYSYAAVPVGTSPAIGAALLDTWSSWNPSADQARRRNETLATILSTHFSGGPIDQAVFDKAAADWDAYFRE